MPGVGLSIGGPQREKGARAGDKKQVIQKDLQAGGRITP